MHDQNKKTFAIFKTPQKSVAKFKILPPYTIKKSDKCKGENYGKKKNDKS